MDEVIAVLKKLKNKYITEVDLNNILVNMQIPDVNEYKLYLICEGVISYTKLLVCKKCSSKIELNKNTKGLSFCPVCHQYMMTIPAYKINV